MLKRASLAVSAGSGSAYASCENVRDLVEGQIRDVTGEQIRDKPS